MGKVVKHIRMNGEDEVRADELTEMKLTCRHWEEMRKQTGLKMTDKERLAQLEMAHADVVARINELRQFLKGLEICFGIIAIAFIVKGIILLCAR